MKKCLNLGCGRDYRASTDDEVWLNCDKEKSIKADVYFDLEKAWPLEDSKYDYLFASHVIEHLVSLDHFMQEAWRVLKHDGIMVVVAPYWSHMTAWCDPSHVRAITELTMTSYCKKDIEHNIKTGTCMTPVDLGLDFETVETKYLISESCGWLKEMEPEEQEWHFRHSLNIVEQIQFTMVAKKGE